MAVGKTERWRYREREREAKRQREKTCRRSQRDQELLCEFVRKSSTCAA
ncbi:uncharacterized protein LOC124460340 [Drosophila willistoni]|nr:uncharacterized protein LOC124460340 [Drosophila willistoni]